MLEQHEREQLAQEISAGVQLDGQLLANLESDLHRFAIPAAVKQIRPYTATALAIVSSDAGNMRLVFDPFEHQIIRVVDSDGQTLALRTITVTTDLKDLFRRDTTPDADGVISDIGLLVSDLERATGRKITSFAELCPSIQVSSASRPEQNTGWVISYRDLWEWAVLYKQLMYTTFSQSTLIVRDGLLRSKLFGDVDMRLPDGTKFKSNYFRIMGDLLAARLRSLRERQKKVIYLVGLAKHSQVIDLYRLAWAKLKLFPEGHALFVRIPRDMEIRAYKFPEFARGRDRLIRNADGLCADVDPATGRLTPLGVQPGDAVREDSQFVFGSMHFARFAPETSMPTWAIDIFDDQLADTERIMGYLHQDSMDGFPVPSYPQSIQRAHEAAKLTDFDAMTLHQIIMNNIRGLVNDDDSIDRLLLAGDMASRRY
jgi:hypothetical protein